MKHHIKNLKFMCSKNAKHTKLYISQNAIGAIFKTFFLSFCIIVNIHLAYAQNASILPPAKTTFVDQNGKPLTSGTVDFYIPSTTTRKTTWQDAAETIPNTNPIALDAAGRALILGSGSYRQVVKDRFGNLIWDQITSSTGSSGGGGSTATGDGDLVGTIKPWAGVTAPNQYAFTYGQEVSRTTYSVLFTAITSTQSVFCTSGSPILTGLSDTTNFWIGMSVELSCVAAGFSTVISKTSSTITLAVNANVNLNTTGIFFPWGRGNGTSTFNLPDFRGVVPAGNNNMGGVASVNLNTTYFGATNPNSTGALGGNQSTTLVGPNLPSQTPAGTITNGAITSTFTGAAGQQSLGPGGGSETFSGGGGLGHQVPSGTIISSQATTTFTGTAFSGQISIPFSRIQPTRTTNYIIKITPDVNSATASGVTSLGSMTGNVTCGVGLLCTGNTISISAIAGVNSIQGMTGNIACGLGLSCTSNTINSNAITFITPDQFGAVCDGLTNDAVALQAAVTAAAGKGLFIPSGKTCLTNAVLTVLSNTVIMGASRDVSSIKSTISNRGAIFNMNNAFNITISDLYLQGTRTVTTWALPSFGAIDVEQDIAATSDLGNFTFKNLKLTGFNSTYWIQLSIGNSNFSMVNVVIDNILVTSVTADIPSDATPANNQNYAIAMYGGSNGQGIRNSSVRNITIEGTALCYGVGLYNTHYKFNIINNKILNIGNTNVVAHCTNGIGFTNAYGIFVYDIAGAGFPSADGIISGNYIAFPYSSGIYTVGEADASLAYNDFNTVISGNIVIGQSETDLPIRGAIILNNYTNSSIYGNKLYNNWAGVVVSGQYIGQVDINDNYCSTNISGGSCLSIAGAAGTTGNVPLHNIKNNLFQTTGASSQTVKLTNDSAHYLGAINFSNNTVTADVQGVNLAGLFINSRLVMTNNSFSGIASNSMVDISTITGGRALLENNTFDLGLSTTGIGLKTTSSVINIQGATFMNRTSGAAFAYSGVGSCGTVNNMQFHNILSGNQTVATSLGTANPSSCTLNYGDFVQNLVPTGTTGGANMNLGWWHVDTTASTTHQVAGFR